MERDFREPTREKRTPKAVADGIQGKILAVADISGTPEQVFHAVTSNEVEKWWKMPGSYRRKEWKADVKVGGQWSFAVETNEGKQVRAWGEFCEVDRPKRLVMTRRKSPNPNLGEREETITYTFEPSPYGTLVTVREEGLIGRSQAAYGDAEIWEKALGQIDAYLGSK